MYTISESILSYILWSEDFAKKVVVHLKDDYFELHSEIKVFSTISDHIRKFNHLPSKEEILLDLDDDKDISAIALDDAEELITKLFEAPCATWSHDNMFVKAENYAKDRSLFIALSESIEIAQDEGGKLSKTAIPKLMSDALAVTFDNSVGHDYFADFRDRYDFYNENEEKIPFDIQILNTATHGGVSRGTLNIIYGGVNVGKSLSLCHLAASYLDQGLNVLFVTCEMSENVTAQRIDANLFKHDINKLGEMSDVEYERALFKAKDRAKNGKLFIKFFPPLTATSGHIDNLIEELKIKKNGFVPDIIIVDYIGILGSSTVNMGKGGVNTNTYFKFVSEELRALACKWNAICWTAQQFNRTGFSSSDPDLDDAAESFGVTATADFVISLTTNDELMVLGQYYLKILKTRSSAKNVLSNFNVGVDFNHMRLYDLPSSMSGNSALKTKIKERESYDKEKPKNRLETKKAAGIDFS